MDSLELWDKFLKQVRDTGAAMIAARPIKSPDDEALIRRFIAETQLDAAAEARIDRRATELISAIRAGSGAIGGLEDFLREFALSTREGLAQIAAARRRHGQERGSRAARDRAGARGFRMGPARHQAGRRRSDHLRGRTYRRTGTGLDSSSCEAVC